MLKKIEEFVVIGGGLMGAGIAQVKMLFIKKHPGTQQNTKQFDIICLNLSITFHVS